MTRRPVLPGASELFRRTDSVASASEVTELPNLSTTASSPALRGGGSGRRAGAETGEPLPGSPLPLVPGGPSAQEADLAAFRGAREPVPTLKPSVPTRG